jgi:hypothetical protein
MAVPSAHVFRPKVVMQFLVHRITSLVTDPLLLRKSSSGAGNRTRTSESIARNSLDHNGSPFRSRIPSKSCYAVLSSQKYQPCYRRWEQISDYEVFSKSKAGAHVRGDRRRLLGCSWKGVGGLEGRANGPWSWNVSTRMEQTKWSTKPLRELPLYNKGMNWVVNEVANVWTTLS